MKVAILWLVNEKGDILLSQRAATMTTDAGVWGPSVSGKIDEGETALQAALREANEELGINSHELASTKHLHEASHITSSGELREFSVFCAHVSARLIDSLKLEAKEVAAVQWITLSGLKELYNQHPEMIIIAHDAKIWQEIFTHLQAVLKEV